MILKWILEKTVSIVKIWTFVSKPSDVNHSQFSEIFKPQKMTWKYLWLYMYKAKIQLFQQRLSCESVKEYTTMLIGFINSSSLV